jgi:hypothetical protein
MENQVLSFEEIKRLFPDEWVLLGNPEYDDDDLILLNATVIAHNKDKRELALTCPDWRTSFETATCVFTGTFAKRTRYTSGLMRLIRSS